MFSILTQVREFAKEGKRVREKKVVTGYLDRLSTRFGELFASLVYAGMTSDWPLDALRAA